MSTQSATWISVSLTVQQPIFDPNLDIATVVFSHVQCVKTRLNLALVSKLWRDASKPAAAYPLEFDVVDAFCIEFWGKDTCTRDRRCVLKLMDNDEALSLPYERVVGLLGGAAEKNPVCIDAAQLGCVRLLKWAREHNFAWSSGTCSYAALHGHLSTLQYSHENGCPWDWCTCLFATQRKHWDCLQYAVDNKCADWEKYAEKYAEHLR